jgi:two-component system, cell cycle sensor histidine kinase and response regulator CckA
MATDQEDGRREELIETLRVSEARYRALVRASSDAVWVHDATLGIFTMSDSARWWEELTGQTPGEASVWGWLECIHLDDRAHVREAWTKSLQDGSPYEVKYRIRARDGRYRHMLVRGVPIRNNDESIREWVGTFHDMTDQLLAERALQQSEERFRAFMDNSPAAASIIDTEGRIVYASETFVRTFLVPSGDPVGCTLFDVFSADIAQSWLDAGRKALDAGTAIETTEPGIRADGTEGTFLTYRFPLNGSGDVPLVGGIAADITERRRLEDQLRHVHKMEAVGQLAGGVAHDFNNVLTVIQGFSDLVLGELPATHVLVQPVSEIKRAGQRATELTGQLLAFSRKAVVCPILLDLNEVVADAENLLRRLIGEDIDFTATLDPGLWRVEADPVQIDQLLLNLVSNARDAMPLGGSLSVETRNVVVGVGEHVERRLPVPPGSYVCLSVADTGCGMDPATTDRIFEPFFTTKEPGKGTGMGLAAVYGIVQQFNGHIKVESQPGAGASFHIYLPPQHEVEADERQAAEMSPAPRGQETIILVEDDHAVRALSRQVLARHGYIVLEASHGAEAVRICQQYPGTIDLLVSDVVMPVMSGLQVAQRLRELRPGMKTLFVSGYPDDALDAHGVLKAEITLLPKPFTPAALANKVRSVLDS